MNGLLIHASARQIPLADESVQMVVTSPPYWGLRKYAGEQELVWGGVADCEHEWAEAVKHRSAGGPQVPQTKWKNNTAVVEGQRDTVHGTCISCGAWRGAYGLEPTVQMYVEHAVEILREIRRVLRKDGVCFWNVGDSYAGSWGNQGRKKERGTQRPINGGMIQKVHDDRYPSDGSNTGAIRDAGLKPKDLCLIPQRVALAAQADGWWVRSDVIWCLSGGTRLYAKTQKGVMPMMLRDAARLRPETVQLWNGTKWTQVLGWSRTQRKADEFEIVLRSGERISCTPTHKFPTERGLLPASELKNGDTLKRVLLPDSERYPESLIQGAAWFAGLYIAEGSRSGDTIQISGHAREEERWLRVVKFAESHGGSATRSVSGNSMNIRVYGKIPNAIIDHLVSGRTARDKGIATVCWNYGDGFLRDMLDGYLSGDGHWDCKNERWRLGFIRNYNLERDLRTLAARLGFRLVLNPSFVRYKGKKRPTFRGEIRFSNHSRTCTEEIVEIRKSRCREVYDVGVADEPHLFALASGILTHNSKPNPMPESVRDRPTDAYEHVLMLTKSPRYYWDAEAVAEDSQTDPKENYPARAKVTGRGEQPSHLAHLAGPSQDASGGYPMRNGKRNLRNVWTFATQPYKGAHFAVFPEELPRRCIKAASSEKGCCPKCSTPWERVTKRKAMVIRRTNRGDLSGNRTATSGQMVEPAQCETIGWKPGCNCNAGDTVPCLVLDPFGGSGTTGKIAQELGRSFVLLDMNYNGEYAELAKKRIAEPPRTVKKRKVEVPCAYIQPDLFLVQ